jgi:DNA-binding NtrC family response regulator
MDESKQDKLKKILIIDDDESFRKFLKKVVSINYECEIETAENPKIAFKKIGESKPDLIFLDMEMPLMDGFTILKNIRINKKTANIPVIVVTAIASRDLLQGLAKLNVSSYLIKPPEIKKVISEVDKIFKKEKKDAE